MRFSSRVGRFLTVTAMATAGIAVSASPALADHNAYMTVAYYQRGQSQACANHAIQLNLNPFDDWSDAGCFPMQDGRIALVAKHG